MHERPERTEHPHHPGSCHPALHIPSLKPLPKAPPSPGRHGWSAKTRCRKRACPDLGRLQTTTAAHTARHPLGCLRAAAISETGTTPQTAAGAVISVTPHAPRTPHPAPRTPHPAPRTPHPAPRTPHPAPLPCLCPANAVQVEGGCCLQQPRVCALTSKAHTPSREDIWASPIQPRRSRCGQSVGIDISWLQEAG